MRQLVQLVAECGECVLHQLVDRFGWPGRFARKVSHAQELDDFVDFGQVPVGRAGFEPGEAFEQLDSAFADLGMRRVERLERLSALHQLRCQLTQKGRPDLVCNDGVPVFDDLGGVTVDPVVEVDDFT